MWIVTTCGFFSAVQKPNTDFVTVRSRARSDLERLRERYLSGLGPVQEGVGTDYPFRATCSHEEWSEALRHMGQDLDYPNFKNAVAATMGHKRSHLYHDVWAALARIRRDA